MNKLQKGFTLIELMIVVAIIAILAAIALPAYQDYVIRSQVTEGSVLADGAKTAVAEFFSNTGNFPTSNASAGLATNKSITGNYVSQLDVGVVPGQIQVTFADAAPQKANVAINAQILSFSATTSAGSVSWACDAAAGTTVATKYLPTICRQ